MAITDKEINRIKIIYSDGQDSDYAQIVASLSEEEKEAIKADLDTGLSDLEKELNTELNDLDTKLKNLDTGLSDLDKRVDSLENNSSGPEWKIY